MKITITLDAEDGDYTYTIFESDLSTSCECEEDKEPKGFDMLDKLISDIRETEARQYYNITKGGDEGEKGGLSDAYTISRVSCDCEGCGCDEEDGSDGYDYHLFRSKHYPSSSMRFIEKVISIYDSESPCEIKKGEEGDEHKSRAEIVASLRMKRLLERLSRLV